MDVNENGDITNVEISTPFDNIYKPFCADIDGFNKGEDPFGYGIRADGKILIGAHTQEWLEKGMNQED